MVIRPREGEPAPAHDSRLDRYRTGIAVVRDGDVLAGHLATRVDVLWTVAGPFWRRRHIDPLERVEWVLVFQPGANRYGYQRVVDKLEIEEDELEAVLEEWDANRFQLIGPVLQLEWLDGSEADAAWAEYGWN
jgi:hypothetical protein